MTIGELILVLSQYPSNMMVVGVGYEGGYDNARPREVELIVDGNWEGTPEGGHKPTWYYGRHSDKSDAWDDPKVVLTKAICI